MYRYYYYYYLTIKTIQFDIGVYGPLWWKMLQKRVTQFCRVDLF